MAMPTASSKAVTNFIDKKMFSLLFFIKMCVVIYKYERRGSDVLQTHSFRLWSLVLVLWAGSDMARRRVKGGAEGERPPVSIYSN